MKNTLALLAGLLLKTLVTLHAAPSEATGSRPNVIIIMTDDQGYGDIGAHGHPFLKTPNMDKLHAESVRFTDFHVAPMCSPTRGQLITGVDAMKNGSTAVCQGRSMVREEIPMLSNYFADAGYATGLFGKWHLGDSYPYRPQDRGFQEVVSFRAWGLPGGLRSRLGTLSLAQISLKVSLREDRSPLPNAQVDELAGFSRLGCRAQQSRRRHPQRHTALPVRSVPQPLPLGRMVDRCQALRLIAQTR